MKMNNYLIIFLTIIGTIIFFIISMIIYITINHFIKENKKQKQELILDENYGFFINKSDIKKNKWR